MSVATSPDPQAGPRPGPSGDVKALAPLSVTTVAAYAPCPHHKGECPGCGDKVKADKPAPSRLTAALNASRAPKDLRDQLEDLLSLADKPDRHDIVAGSGQALFARLKACLPEAVVKPDRPKRPGLFGMIVDAFSPLPVPAKDAQGVLKRRSNSTGSPSRAANWGTACRSSIRPSCPTPNRARRWRDSSPSWPSSSTRIAARRADRTQGRGGR